MCTNESNVSQYLRGPHRSFAEIITDIQLVILSAAAQREGGEVLPLPSSLKIKGSAVTKTLEGLRKRGLLEEQPAAPNAEAWRETEDGRRMMLVITEAGLRAIGGGKESAAKKPQPKKRRAHTTQKPTAPRSKGKTPSPAVRPGTKQALLIDLLKRKNGAAIDEAVEATGWQPHSVRGAISGALKKKLGLTVISATVEGRGRVYRIVEPG